MRRYASLAAALLAVACALPAAAPARADVAVPPLVHRVTDLTGTLTGEQQQALEQSLTDFETRKGSQIAVLIVPTTQPETIEQYSIGVAEAWKLGRKGVDDGVLLLIAKDDHRVRIEVGYGLEGALPDVAAKRIIEEDITPRFKSGDFYGGIAAGLDRIMRTVDGEPLPPAPQHPPGRSGGEGFEPLLVIGFVLVFVVGGVLRAIFGRMLGAGIVGTLVAVVAWFIAGALAVALIAGVLAFVFGLLGGGRGFSSFPGGGFGGGGFGGGGGFSGGGGGFGGGGSSGSW